MPDELVIDMGAASAAQTPGLNVSDVPGNPNAVNVTEKLVDPLAPKVDETANKAGDPAKKDEETAAKPDEKKADEAAKDPAKKEEAKPDEDPEKKIVEDAGLDYQAIVDEYKTNQGLTPETDAKLKEAVKKAGLPEEIVDAYFDNLKAQEELFTQRVHSMVGGQEGFNDMAAWARQNLSEKELKTFSDLAEAGDSDQALMAIRLLHSQYRQAVQTGGNRIRGDAGPAAAGGNLIRSQTELAELMASPEYAKSPARRREVQERLHRSVVAGVFQ